MMFATRQHFVVHGRRIIQGKIADKIVGRKGKRVQIGNERSGRIDDNIIASSKSDSVNMGQIYPGGQCRNEFCEGSFSFSDDGNIEFAMTHDIFNGCRHMGTADHNRHVPGYVILPRAPFPGRDEKPRLSELIPTISGWNCHHLDAMSAALNPMASPSMTRDQMACLADMGSQIENTQGHLPSPGVADVGGITFLDGNRRIDQ
ncbi:MAG: hypothetical protein MZV49_25665 [Rhodopseudomonas palustris]|nr:hypothetical protein [Rhodopseudomonas palustris]